MSKQYKNVIESSCHCGNVRMKLHTDREEHEFTPRTCQCSLCRSHGASWISDPDGEVKLRFDDHEMVNNYRFGHKTADYIVCKSCGVLTIVVSEIEGRKRAVLNITAMTDQNFTAEPIQTNFDGEPVDGRLERRGKNWTGNVIIE